MKAKWEKSGFKLPPLKYFRHMKNNVLCPVIQGAEPSGKPPGSKRTPPKMALVKSLDQKLIDELVNRRFYMEAV